jgi:hypothetical protein
MTIGTMCSAKFLELRGLLPTELVGFLLYLKVADRGLGWVLGGNDKTATGAVRILGTDRWTRLSV